MIKIAVLDMCLKIANKKIRATSLMGQSVNDFDEGIRQIKDGEYCNRKYWQLCKGMINHFAQTKL